MTEEIRGQAVLLWGSVATGKSGVLGALYDLGRASTSKAMWSLSPGDAPPRVTEHLVSLRNGLLDGSTNPTVISSQYPTMDLLVRKRKHGRTVARMPLSFVDPAGEFADNVQRLRDSGSDLLQRMLTARGIIWLFDASRPGVDHDAVFGQLTTLTGLTGGDLVKTPIALCLSKIDLLPPKELERAQQNPEEALKRHIGEDNLHLFSCVFPTRNYFALSSRGTTREAIKPIGLNDVFDWIYDGEQRRVFGERVKRERKRFLKVALGFALLCLLGYGGATVYAERKSRNEQRELELLGQLERAGAEYADGNLEHVVTLLAGEGLDKHERALEWDTLYVLAATELGLQRHAASSDGDALLAEVLEHANQALERETFKDPQARARITFARAQACGALQCGRPRIKDDLEYVARTTTDRGLQRRAREALEELK